MPKHVFTYGWLTGEPKCDPHGFCCEGYLPEDNMHVLVRITGPEGDAEAVQAAVQKALNGLIDTLDAAQVNVQVIEPITTEDGVTYSPWTNGYAVGYEAEHYGKGSTEYVYLNPSQTGSADDDQPNVFVYHSNQGDPGYALEGPVTHITLFEGRK